MTAPENQACAAVRTAYADKHAAVLAEIRRLRRWLRAGAPLCPLDIHFETFDVELAIVTGGGNDSDLQSIARVQWYPERDLEGDREVGPEYSVVERVEVWAAVDGPGLPMRDITGLLGKPALEEISGHCQAEIDGRLEQRFKELRRRVA